MHAPRDNAPPVDAAEIARRVNAGEISAHDVVHAAIESAHALNPKLNAFLEIHDHDALARARAIDDERTRTQRPLRLAGVPIAVKDNICLASGRTTCASRILEHYRSPYTATALQRLIDEGAVVVGKTNLDEFGMGSSCENSAFGPTRNPWDLSRVPGGSSGGSAAAVAARIAPVALGSDTGGSIRQPAGMCSVVGFKPSYGRISRYGLVAYASSLDQIGPMALSVRDCALLAEIMSGPDESDPTTAREPEVPALRALAELEEPLENLRIGVPRAARSARGNHPGVNSALESAIASLERSGASVVDVDLALLEESIAAYYIIAPAEASSNLARFDGIRYGRRTDPRPGDDLAAVYARSRSEGLGPEVQRRIMLGTHVLSSGYADRYFHTALKVRRLVRRAYDEALARCDALMMPASPTPAFRIGERADDPLAMYLGDVYTVGVNLAGLPAITLPAGFTDDAGTRLPIGIQLIAGAFDDARLLRAARMFENAAPHARQPPPIT